MAKTLRIEECNDCYHCKEREYSHDLIVFCEFLDKDLKVKIPNDNHTHFINLKDSVLKIKIPKECPLKDCE